MTLGRRPFRSVPMLLSRRRLVERGGEQVPHFGRAARNYWKSAGEMACSVILLDAMKFRHLMTAQLAAASVMVSVAAGEPTPQPTVRGELPREARPIAEVVVPIPSEVFGSLDRFANSNWRRVQLDRLTKAKARGDQTQIALLLGVVIGEAFIAVQARDALEVKEIGAAALKLARALGVEPAVMRRSKSIIEHADKNDWPAVRREWDAVLPDVQEGMKQLRSEDLSQLVSLGGWLRGTKALTVLILQHYSPEDAELLRQPALLERFEKELGGMAARPTITKMRQGVVKMRSLVGDPGQPVTEKVVRELSTLCDDLLGSIDARARQR
jgi:hypothetical protein